jgi:hypothetical protein
LACIACYNTLGIENTYNLSVGGELLMPNLTDCPFIHQCVHGGDYPDTFHCNARMRLESKLFQCVNFEQTEFLDMDELPDDAEELFPDFDYENDD